jgi:RNA polymerase sigma-70 factor (ECF subfamily)
MHQTEPLHQEPDEGSLPAREVVEQLVYDYSKLVFHIIYAMTGHWQESQDLTQDVFLHALVGIDAARAVTGPCFQGRAWLLRIAVNLVRMRERRARLYRFQSFSAMEDRQEAEAETSGEAITVKAAPVQPPGYASPEPADPAELVAERDVVERTLAKLPESLRLPLLLSIVAGCSHTEISRILDLQEITVRQRLSRARRAFQSIYAEESGEVVRVATQNQRESPHSREVHRPASAMQMQVAIGL